MPNDFDPPRFVVRRAERIALALFVVTAAALVWLLWSAL